MMKTKTRWLAGVLVLMSGAAIAQPAPHAHSHGAMDIDKLEILLDLDAYQKQELQKIFDARREAMIAKRKELRAAQTRPNFEEMRSAREAEQKQTRAQLEKLLTEQQLKKFDVLAERPARGHKPRRMRG